jgi:tetratricopeptide (TPR) repeat protein
MGERLAGGTMTETAVSDFTVLAGAGGSWRAGLPTALELADDILGKAIRNREVAEELRQWCRADHTKRRHPYDYLRFESLMAVIAEIIDPRLVVLRCLERAQKPSPLQRRLADMAAAGALLITPNFDDLLERALYDSLRESDRAGVRAPVTVDAHSRTVLPPGAVPVVKLHGSLISHRGGRGRRVATQVQATPEQIIAHSPGLMLTGRAAARLREAVNGRTLLMVGYSASDDLDVVPALRATLPARVIWVDHSNAKVVTRFAPDSASGNASRDDLLRTWSANGVQVAALRGATEIVLGSLGFGAIAMPERTGLPWRDDITAWVDQHRNSIGNGMALAGMLWGQLERWDAKRNALLHAHRPRGTIEQLGWTRSRRAYELAQTGFLSNEPDPQVRRWGRAAQKYAREEGDRQAEAMALLLLGRQAASNDDYDKAIDLHRQAMDAVPKSTIVYAQAAERCANALVFVQRPREALALTDPIMRLLGGPGGSIDTLVDAHQTRGLACRALGRMRRAVGEFGKAAAISERFSMEQQHFAARSMLGVTLWLLGDLDHGREALLAGLAAAARSDAYPTEVATAHHYLARLERSAGRPQAALDHLAQAAKILQGGQAGPGTEPLRMLNKLLFAELYACTGDKAKAAKLLQSATRGRQIPGGQPEAMAALVQHILQPTRATAAELDRCLGKVRHQEAAVYVDLALTLARHGTADTTLAAHVERAKAHARRWARP